MTEISKVLQESRQAAIRKEQEERLELYTKLFARQFERASAYTKGVVAIGYASIFAIWSFSKGLMPPTAHAAAALLLICSVIVFTLWEVYTNLSSATPLGSFGQTRRYCPTPLPDC